MPFHRRCSVCSAAALAEALERGMHVCHPDNLIAHQTVKARRGLERLELEVAEYLRTPRAQKLLAFKRWYTRRRGVR
jgi:hypothetical protein